MSTTFTYPSIDTATHSSAYRQGYKRADLLLKDLDESGLLIDLGERLVLDTFGATVDGLPSSEAYRSGWHDRFSEAVTQL